MASLGSIPHLPTIFTQILNNVLAGRQFAIRKDIPFDNWFYKTTVTGSPNNEREKSLSGRIELAESALFGAAYAVMETVRYVYSLFFKPNEANQHSKAFKEQLHGTYLSTLAIYSTQSARMQFLQYWSKPENINSRSPRYIFTGSVN